MPRIEVNGARQGQGAEMAEDTGLRRKIETVWQDTLIHAAGPAETLTRGGSGAGETTVPGAAGTRTVPPGGHVRGRTPSNYEVIRRLGEGGLGVVYQARQKSVDRTVALKLIKPEAAATDDARDRFVAEGVATAGLDHPNIVPVYDLETASGGAAFYAMKEVRGMRWSEVLWEKTRDENIEILLRVADAVGFAHFKGIVHRDLKPENVMLGDFGEVLVMDWSLAVPVGGGASQLVPGGTPAYMPPELARNDVGAIGPHTDIYLLGAILYEIMAGRRPHDAPTVMECLARAAANRIEEETEGGELVDIALRAMSTAPADRYVDATAFRSAVAAFRRHEESIAIAARAADDLARAGDIGEYRLYARALFGYEQALELWPESGQAQAGAEESRLRYAECAHERRDFDLSLSLLDPQVPRHADLARRAESARRARDGRLRRARLLQGVAVGLVLLAIAALAVAIGWVQAARQDAAVQRQRAEDGLADLKAEQERRAEARRESAPLLVGSARALIEQREFAGALATAESAIGFDDALLEPRLMRAALLARGGDYARAAAAYGRLAAMQDPVAGVAELADLCRKAELEGADVGVPEAFVDPIAAQGLPLLAAQFAPSLDRRVDLYRTRVEGMAPGAWSVVAGQDGKLEVTARGSPRPGDLTPLRGLPIRRLKLQSTPVVDLSPLRGMQLEDLDMRYSRKVRDISPLAGMPLRFLRLNGKATDAGPLRGAPLEVLHIPGTVSDLSPLAGMPLRELRCGYPCTVTNLAPLAGMRLEHFSAHAAPITDLSPLAGMPLAYLNINSTRVEDLSPLRGMPLESLSMASVTEVRDIEPLRGAPLRELNVPLTAVTNFSPLEGMPLEILTFDSRRVAIGLGVLRELPLREVRFSGNTLTATAAAALRGNPNIETVQVQIGSKRLRLPPAEFWPRYDAGEFGRPADPTQPRAARRDPMAGFWGASASIAFRRITLDPQFRQLHAYVGRFPGLGLPLSVVEIVRDRFAQERSVRREWAQPKSTGVVPETPCRLRILTPSEWHTKGLPHASVCYYLNDSFSRAGHPLVGQRGCGALEMDQRTGRIVRMAVIRPHGARSVLVLGGRHFASGGDRDGVVRLDEDWQDVTAYVNPGNDLESITTDGKWLFTNNDVQRGFVHAYRVENAEESFSLHEQWRCDLGGGRVRGLSYGGNGYLYCSIGADGPDRSVFALRTEDGAAVDVGVDVPGVKVVYGVLRHSLGGSDFLLAADTGNLYVWTMDGDTGVAEGPPDTYPSSTLGLDNPIYGLSALGDRLFLSNGPAVACFRLGVAGGDEAVE